MYNDNISINAAAISSDLSASTTPDPKLILTTEFSVEPPEYCA